MQYRIWSVNMWYTEHNNICSLYIEYKVSIISVIRGFSDISYIIHASSLKCKLFRLERGYNTFVKHITMYIYVAIGLYLFYKRAV